MSDYSIIYADPPWKFNNEQDKNPARGGAKYDKMSLEDICNLPVNDIAAKHSALFLWVPRAKTPEGLECMARWGFKYTTTVFTWIKLNKKGFAESCIDGDDIDGHTGLFLGRGIYSGMGYWVNGNTEIVLFGQKDGNSEVVLFGKKGAPKRNSRRVKELIFAPVSRHSEKPPETRDRIVELMGDLSRIELFARGSVPEGWDAWGNQADNSIKHLFGYSAADDPNWMWW